MSSSNLWGVKFLTTVFAECSVVLMAFSTAIGAGLIHIISRIAFTNLDTYQTCWNNDEAVS
jgi:hypothetical protein